MNYYFNGIKKFLSQDSKPEPLFVTYIVNAPMFNLPDQTTNYIENTKYLQVRYTYS